ncbi:MAG TPA: metallophosphoesterase [Thermoanaerobaculia bacterium]|nr:metallophosphoesterase [Thermoanaerobaculia bacterium]
MLAFVPLTALARDPAWIAYGPSGPIARTIVSGDCPAITIDGVETRMRIHSTPSAAYPVTACEHAIPAHAKSASIGETKLPVAKLQRTAKVAILGDTGCRRKASSSGKASIQDCADQKKWPFATVANTIAEWDPDLILHVGDYYYREAMLQKGKWVQAPYTWKRWHDDFFKPAEKLLPNAPWVLVRGNHESCSRAAEGWFRFLDPRNYVWENVKTCTSNTDFTPPYVAQAGELRFIVFDSAAVHDWEVLDDQKQMFINQLGLYAKSPSGSWLMLHHPFWSQGPDGEETPVMAEAWQAAGANVPPLALVLAGHIHLLELLSFTDNAIPQFVVGNGGTALDDPVSAPTQLGGRTVAEFYQDDDFGFIAATREGETWKFEVRSKDGKVKKVW